MNNHGVALALLGCSALLVAYASGSPAKDEAPGIGVVATHEGWRPATLKARRGETLRLLLRSEDEEHCFAIDAYRVEKRVVPGRTTRLEFTVDRPGTFPFHCCLEPKNEALRGELVVAE